jgi:hypothetical protein
MEAIGVIEKFMNLKAWQRNILTVFIIVIGSFILFNLAFSLAALIINGLAWIFKLFVQSDDVALNMMYYFYVYYLMILLISMLIFKSKANILLKATFLPLPVMVTLLLIGINLFERPKWIPITIGALILSGLFAFLKRKNLPWQYYCLL